MHFWLHLVSDQCACSRCRAPVHDFEVRRRSFEGAAEPARHGHPGLTRASATIGSPPYMAPEQWTDPTAVGPAADIYALGIIAYEGVTGHRPFSAETSEATAS
jgi:serine/threonine protein kinase